MKKETFGKSIPIYFMFICKTFLSYSLKHYEYLRVIWRLYHPVVTLSCVQYDFYCFWIYATRGQKIRLNPLHMKKDLFWFWLGKYNVIEWILRETSRAKWKWYTAHKWCVASKPITKWNCWKFSDRLQYSLRFMKTFPANEFCTI